VSGDSGSFSHVSVHVGADWRVDCHTYDGHTPIFSVDAGQCAVSFSVKDRCADDAALLFTRALIREAQVFAAEVERLHTGQADAGDLSGNGSEPKAARDAAA
jgi:hypothetical protein